MIRLLDTVRTTKALPEHGLGAGAFGCVVEVGAGPVYLVEFCNGNGETLAIVELKRADLVPAPQVVGKT